MSKWHEKTQEVAFFDRSGEIPHFSVEELKQIYDATKVKTTAAMRAKAVELFQGRDDIYYQNIHIWEGPGRSFKHDGDDYVKPKYVINAYPLMVGVMEDGTVYPF